MIHLNDINVNNVLRASSSGNKCTYYMNYTGINLIHFPDFEDYNKKPTLMLLCGY